MGDWLPIFPLSTVLFPNASLSLHVFEPRYRAMTKQCLDGDRLFGVVLISRGSEVGGGEARMSVGTTAHIERASLMADGRSLLLVRGTERFRVVRWLTDDPFPRGVVQGLDPGPAAVEPVGSEPVGSEPVGSETFERLVAAAAALKRARALLSELREVPMLSAVPPGDPDSAADADRISWWLCNEAPVSAWDRQRLLEAEDLDRRLELLEDLAGSVADDLSRMLASQ